MPVRFGATIVQVLPYSLLRDDFVFAESIGLDNAWVIDQFGIDEAPEVALLEAWTTLAALARENERMADRIDGHQRRHAQPGAVGESRS